MPFAHRPTRAVWLLSSSLSLLCPRRESTESPEPDDCQAREAAFSFSPLIPFRLGLVSNSTVEFSVPALEATAARYGIALECVHGAYGQAIQEAINPDSIIDSSDVDAVLIAIDFRGFPIRCKPGSAEDERAAIDAALSYLQTIRSGLARNGKALCLLQTLAPPPESLWQHASGVLLLDPALRD